MSEQTPQAILEQLGFATRRIQRPGKLELDDFKALEINADLIDLHIKDGSFSLLSLIEKGYQRGDVKFWYKDFGKKKADPPWDRGAKIDAVEVGGESDGELLILPNRLRSSGSGGGYERAFENACLYAVCLKKVLQQKGLKLASLVPAEGRLYVRGSWGRLNNEGDFDSVNTHSFSLQRRDDGYLEFNFATSQDYSYRKDDLRIFLQVNDSGQEQQED
jgi:hypothetical protein